MSARGYLGSGDLYLNRIVNGVAQGWEGPFECNKFEIKANSELKEQTSRGKATYGQIIESVPVPKPFDLNITMTELNKQGLMLALMGTAAVLTQSSGSIADEVVQMNSGKWAVLSKANFNGPLTVKDSAGTTTYAEGTDYVVNRAMGWVQMLDSGAITDAENVKVSGAYLAITGDMISGATQPSVRAQFKLDGVNFADGLANIVTVREAVISSDAAIDFLSDNFASLPLKGRMKTPAGFIEPFTIEKRTA